jgi:hypothetical protein
VVFLLSFSSGVVVLRENPEGKIKELERNVHQIFLDRGQGKGHKATVRLGRAEV